ncbi:MAG: nucleotidyl transferase AbiEii/AbiGii toxin family protein [Verrucomicrobia bacterium]|nr:nucleotidyl transferase AbiEii/AbiGii toxin family protein [Verrucomicrobiota bacterium]MDE3098515.1 nucleotidyl transferase AbiEii/AbiGii toxin family protein [Verrucomicrobiota bacterium]
MSFAPKLESLPAPQRKLWPEMARVPKHFVLYGGTAVALHYGHRASADFDFFTSEPVNPDELMRSLGFLRGGKPLQAATNTLEVEVVRGEAIRIQFLGGLSHRRVGDPLETDDKVLRVASPLDLLATKLRTIWMRGQMKDFLDIDELLRQGVGLKNGLGAAYAVFNGEFNSHISLRALGYFDDGDLPSLPEAVKKRLMKEVNSTIGEALPQFEPLPGGLVPAEKR